MAKKKKKGKKQPARRKSAPPPLSIDRNLFEGILEQLENADQFDEAIDEADALIDEAWDEPDPHKRVALAKQALEIDPDCIDAYVLLSDEAPTRGEALGLLRQAVAAGERIMGPDAFERHDNRFWLAPDTRPYMHARHELANFLWVQGNRNEAIEHYRELLRLNPHDHQGVRYVLAACLLSEDRNDEAEQHFQAYEENTADWLYGRTLLAYRKEGESAGANELLAQAYRVNRHVPLYLLGEEPLPTVLPELIDPGGESEAMIYASGSLPAWKGTPGAVTWLRQTLRILPRDDESEESEPPPFFFPVEDLLELPQDDETWQVDVKQFPRDLQFQGRTFRPWALVVFDATNGFPLAATMADSRPNQDKVLGALVDCMETPREGEPRRPMRIELRLKTLANGLRKRMQSIEVSVVHRPKLPEVSAMMDEALAEFAPGRAAPASLDVAELPQASEEIWQADVVRVPSWTQHNGLIVRPWTVLVVNHNDGTVLAQQVDPEPKEAWFRDRVLEALRQPFVGEPRRPASIQVRSEAQRQMLAPFLMPAGIECSVHDELDALDDAYESLVRHIAENDAAAALVDTPGVRLEQLGSFFEAAAQFYRQQPWRSAPSDQPIQIECRKFTNGLWQAVVMGQSGMELGLALYEDPQYVGRLLAGGYTDFEAARANSSLSLLYGEAFQMSAYDLTVAEQEGWPLAGPEAHPIVFRLNPGMAVRRPLAWELELLEGALRAIPEFLAQSERTAKLSVPVASGPLELTLSWLDGR
jgi:tetratricopeptide (TPR) repeat protein